MKRWAVWMHLNIIRTLFEAAKEWAKENGANKLYISAHSAVESQLFYKAMGCTEAQVYNQEHVKAEPYDCQLERKLETVYIQTASYLIHTLYPASGFIKNQIPHTK